jgi:hypothetical protein
LPGVSSLLAYPARIGRSSQTFLEWYGTEFMCVKGHGVPHVPEIPTLSFQKRRWRVRIRRFETVTLTFLKQ